MTPASRWALPAAASICFLAMLAWAYWPGLAGPFLFDDFGNLDVLGAYGHIHGWRDLLFYATSGNADPTGRPVALLTFLLDASNWPADAWPFKRTNLLLHLVNTALLAVAVDRLQTASARRAGIARPSRWIPLVAAALWAAHPFLVSTTLYVIQREAMLPVTFGLLGILAWVQAVSRLEAGRLVSGWCWAVLGLGTATLLAGLSKGNGFLTPTLAGVAHLWFLRPGQSSHRRWVDVAALACLAIPTLLLLCYLVGVGWTWWDVAQVPGRDWTIPQRLLSEPRAIWTYVWRLVLPRAGGGGLYVEDFPASSGWLQPWTTLPAILALLAATAAAIAWRRRFPILTFAWIFFVGAQLLESSVVPLELYFEHRVYLAGSMLGWPLANALLRDGVAPGYRRTFVVLLLAALLLLTRERASVWGNPELLGALSAAHETDSARAQVEAATQEIELGRLAAGLDRLHALQRKDPQSVDAAITAIGAECSGNGRLSAETLTRAQRTLATTKVWNNGLYQWMRDAAVDPVTRGCRGFGLDGLRSLVGSAGENPQLRPRVRRRTLDHVRGRIALASNDPQTALAWFDEVLRVSPDPDFALVQAAALGDAGFPALGVSHLDHYAATQATAARSPRSMADIHAWLLVHLGFYRTELTSLRAQLQADADRSVHAAKGSPTP